MCGRYAIFGPHSRYREHFDVDTWPDFADHYNAAPSLWLPVIRQAPDGRRVADLLRWGLIPNWAKDPAEFSQPINAKAESAATKPMFRHAFKKSRVLVPAGIGP